MHLDHLRIEGITPEVKDTGELVEVLPAEDDAVSGARVYNACVMIMSQDLS